MGFKEWIIRYYGMPVSRFIESDLVKNISFNDLTNAYNAGLVSKNKIIKDHSYLIIMDENLFFTDQLSPEIMEKAISQKAFLVDCTSRLYFSNEGWVELKEGSNGTKEEEGKGG